MSRSILFTFTFVFLGLHLAPATARAGECSISCGADGSLGACSIEAKGPVKCKCNPYAVCKRIFAIETTTLDDFAAAGAELLPEIDAHIEAALELDRPALAGALERMREAVVADDPDAYAAALAEHDRLAAAKPSRR